MNKKSKNSLVILTECSIMVALASVLSLCKLFEMPYGGSITLCSMLPIVIIAYRHGTMVGVAAALAESAIQLLLGLSYFSYFTTWQSVVVLGVFDYVLAFTVFGLCGLIRPIVKDQMKAMALGGFSASFLRYVCHVISGATVWAGLSIPTKAALLYSLSYNATYMIPESIILVLSCIYVGGALDFTGRIPKRRVMAKQEPAAAYCALGAGLAAICTLAADTVLVFSKLQNADSGEFFIGGLAEVNWLAVIIVTIVGALVGASLLLVQRHIAKRAA